MAVVTVLGPVTLGDAGPALSPRDRKVLQALVARRDRQVSSDALAEALWGEEPAASSTKVVQGCIGRLRRRLVPGRTVDRRRRGLQSGGVGREGFVGVWDLGTGALVDRATPGLGRLHGVQWRHDHDLFIMSARGAVVEFTTDPERLLALVRDSLTRGISENECLDYGIAPCPGLADLRGARATVPPELRGVHGVSWTAEDLESAVLSHDEAAFEAALDGVGGADQQPRCPEIRRVPG